MKATRSYNVQIWCGLQKQYTDTVYSITDVRRICDEYVNEIKDCVTITPTEYRYVGGHEEGVLIGWINYPRFPRKRREIRRRAFILAGRLKEELEQYKVSIVTPNKTYMI